MNRAKARRGLDFDRLECKQLLATGAGIIPPSALTYTHNFLPAAEAGLLQTDASAKNLEMFVARLGQLGATRPDVQQYANQIILDDMAAELQGHLLAKNKDVVLPPDLIGQDVAVARQIVAALNTPNFDQTFLTTMVQINTTATAAGSANARLSTTSIDTDVRNLAQSGLATDQTHLTAAQNLINRASSGIGTGAAPTPTNTTTVSTNDVNYLQTVHSSNNFEILTSQIAHLTSTNTDEQQYATKLLFDHTMAENLVLQLANANGVSLSPTLAPTAAAAARALLTTATNTGAYDPAYLAVQIPMHQMTMQADSQEAATTQNPNLREFARSDVATTAVHILAARQILDTQPNAILPSGINSENLQVRVRPINRFTYTLTARLNAGGFYYNSGTTVRFPRRLSGNALPRPTNDQVRTALFRSLNLFLNGIANTSTTGTGMTS